MGPPGARVPVLPEPLAPREMGGIVSNGMLCSPRELALADVHTGILVLNAEAVLRGRTSSRARPRRRGPRHRGGTEPARLPQRGGGGARGLGAHGSTARRPPPATGGDAEAAGEVASIRIDALDGCPRYVARVIRGIGGGTTPIRAQARLTACGMRPISPVVDATNYAMLELGQPLHAFDLHRLEGPGIVVRRAADGEPLRSTASTGRWARAIC